MELLSSAGTNDRCECERCQAWLRSDKLQTGKRPVLRFVQEFEQCRVECVWILQGCQMTGVGNLHKLGLADLPRHLPHFVWSSDLVIRAANHERGNVDPVK